MVGRPALVNRSTGRSGHSSPRLFDRRRSARLGLQAASLYGLPCNTSVLLAYNSRMILEELMTQPTPDYAAARRAMIDSQLRPEGVTDPNVLAAMAAVPREQYVPEALRPLAYSDRPLDLGEGKALMPPAALAKLLTEMEPRAGERALVVGSGNGYAAGVLEALGLAAEQAEGHHSAGKAIYDLILIDGAVEDIPAGLVARLAPNGRLGAAIADNGVTRLAVGRVAGGILGLRRFADAEVPVLPSFTRPRAFTF
jgi:protein-L-isoaspartate(D-aspartate) O-methyltransferase